MSEEFKMQFELLQPWSTFVMKTQLPPLILEKMIKITDEILENKEPTQQAGEYLAGQIEDEFSIPPNILKREGLIPFFLDVCRTYVIQASCQAQPFDKEDILKDEWKTRLTRMWVNSQKDNEYFPNHIHTECALSAVMYLKIPEYLPSRKTTGPDGAIEFLNNSSQDQIWGWPIMTIHPQVGDFFIFPAVQRHQVYPFRTPDGKGERRSVSFNAGFTRKSEQDYLKKQQEDQEAI